MDPLTIASLSIQGAGALGSLYDQITGSSSKKQYERQQELMKLQQSFNVHNWELQNAYNQPSKQVERLRAAGLNPILHGVDGSSSSLAPVGLGSPPDEGSIKNANLQSIARASELSLANKEMQVQQQNADTAKTNAATERMKAVTERFTAEENAELTREQTNYQKIMSAYQQFQNDHNLERFQAEMSKYGAETQELEERAGVHRSEVSVNEQQIKNLVQDLINGKQITAAQVKALSAQAADTLAHVKVNDATVDYIKTEDFGKRIQNFVDAYTAENKLGFSALQNVKIGKECVILIEKAFNEIKEGKRLDAVTKQIENDVNNANLDDKSKAVLNLVTMGIFGRFFGAKGAAATPFIRKYEKVNGQEVPIFNLYGQ